MNASSGTKRASGGMTLVEVMVAVLILSIGLLGLARLQMTVLRSNHSAYLRSQATLLAQEISERMLANRAAALDGAYEAANCALNPDCLGWAARVPGMLGDGATGTVEREAGNEFVITIQWNDDRARIRDGSGAASADDTSVFVYRTEI